MIFSGLLKQNQKQTYILRDVSSCSRREKLVPYSPLFLFYFYTTWFWEKRLGFHYHRRAGACNASADFFLERAEQTVGAGTQKEPSQRPWAWWKFSPTSRVNCLLMKAYASHLLATEELEWFQKHSKTDIPSNIWCERVIHTQKLTPLISAGLSTDTKVAGYEPRPCHTLRTEILPVQFVYSLILISGESSGLQPAANWFNKQHHSLEEDETVLLQWEHVTETWISVWVWLRAS